MREWKDAKTGRVVRQVTEEPEGASVGYFRVPRLLPDGRILASTRRDERHCLLAIDPETASVEALSQDLSWPLRLRESDGTMWFFKPPPVELPNKVARREYMKIHELVLCSVRLPDGKPDEIAVLPKDLPGSPADITCDGRTIILVRNEQDRDKYPIPFTKDAKTLWRYFNRPRRGTMWSYDLHTGRVVKMVHEEGVGLDHIDTSPTDPTLVRFCHDAFPGQRIWVVRTDGTGLRKIRPTDGDEVIVHEFWWPDGSLIAYKYQDRRNDPTLHEQPWGEYAPVPTQFGLADLEGRERYLSDALNHYHSHIFVSKDTKYLCGEGTEISSHVCAARFSTTSRRIKFVQMATIHTPYRPFGGQGVNSGFSADSRWLIYNDTVDGKRQVCAVRVDF